MKMNGNEKTKLKSLKNGTLRDTNTLTTPSERSFSSLLVHSSSLLHWGVSLPLPPWPGQLPGQRERSDENCRKINFSGYSRLIKPNFFNKPNYFAPTLRTVNN